MFMKRKKEIVMRGFRRMAGIAQVMAWAVITGGLSAAYAGEVGPVQNPLPTSTITAQRSDTSLSQEQGPSPARELPPGGMSIEDLLLQKGTITMIIV